MYINRGNFLKLVNLLQKIYNFLNKHFYVIAIISYLSKFTNHKIFKFISTIFKIFIIVNIIFGIGYIIYFNSAINQLNDLISIYKDLIQFYIDLFMNIWNDLMNFNIESTSSKDQLIKEINNQVKEGMREALKDVVDEALDKLQEGELEKSSNTIKNVALFGSLLFIAYFVFILPGSSVNPEVLNSYNWLNQSLIEFKLNIMNLFNNKPGNPGNNASSGFNLPILPEVISPVISESSSIGQSTVTPNSPVVNNSNLSPFNFFKKGVNASTQTLVNNNIDSSTQTELKGLEVGRILSTLDVLGEVLDNETQSTLSKHADSVIKNITN
jgi:predicted PurR-regulated permease PerM